MINLLDTTRANEWLITTVRDGLTQVPGAYLVDDIYDVYRKGYIDAREYRRLIWTYARFEYIEAVHKAVHNARLTLRRYDNMRKELATIHFGRMPEPHFYLHEFTETPPDEFHLTIVEDGIEITDEVKAKSAKVLSLPSKIHLYVNDLDTVTVKTNVVELHTAAVYPSIIDFPNLVTYYEESGTRRPPCILIENCPKLQRIHICDNSQIMCDVPFDLYLDYLNYDDEHILAQKPRMVFIQKEFEGNEYEDHWICHYQRILAISTKLFKGPPSLRILRYLIG